MLRTRSVRPSQIGPCALSSLGQRAVVDQRVADRLDAAGRLQARRARTSMQPPAAAATALPGRFTQANG